MNMLLNFARNAIAAAATVQQPTMDQQRTRLVRKYDNRGKFIGYQEVLCYSRKSFKDKKKERPSEHRLKSRGKGGKTAHSFSGVRAVKRAAAKRRNKKG